MRSWGELVNVLRRKVCEVVHVRVASRTRLPVVRYVNSPRDPILLEQLKNRLGTEGRCRRIRISLRCGSQQIHSVWLSSRWGRAEPTIGSCELCRCPIPEGDVVLVVVGQRSLT